MTVPRAVAPTPPSSPMNLDQVNALFAQLGPVLNPLAIEANAETKAWGIAREGKRTARDGKLLALNPSLIRPPAKSRFLPAIDNFEDPPRLQATPTKETLWPQ